MANTLKFGNGEWYGKKDTILAYNDENSNYKPLPFSFSRASKATVINKDGLIETVGAGMPRIDYKDDSEGALLLEPQRSNLYSYSEPTTNEGAAAGVSYESFDWGIRFLNCVKFGDNSTTRYRYGGSVVSATQYTVSAFVIMDDLSEPVVSGLSNTGDFSFVIGGSLATTINSNIHYGNNIYKVSATTISGTNLGNNGIIKYTSQSSKGFRVVGWQLEQGSYATSYIPTSGSTVTRLAERSANSILSNTISIGANEDFAIYYEGSFNAFGDMLLGGGQVGSSPTSKSYLWILNSTTLRITGDGEVLMATCSPELLTNTNYKILVKRSGNVVDFFINGVKLNTTQGTPNTSFTIRSLGWSYSYTIYTTSGKIKNIKTYNTSLTDAQAIALTQV